MSLLVCLQVSAKENKTEMRQREKSVWHWW